MPAARGRSVLVFGVALLVVLPFGVVAGAGTGYGSLGAGVGGSGMVFLPSGFSASALVLQPDGKLVTAGGSKTGFALLRYNPAGSLDTSFGHSGRVTTVNGVADGSFSALVRQPDGKLVAAGEGSITKSTSALVIARYNRDGGIDRSFGSGGRVTTTIGPDYPLALVIQPDGKLVVAGPRFDGRFFALVRYNPDGSLDRTFGRGGRVTTLTGPRDDPVALVLQPDGKLVAAGDGKVVVAGAGSIGAALVRYKPDGRLDSSFGKGGRVTTPNVVGVRALIRQPDGKLVAASTGSDNGFVAELIRYKPDGSLDPSFGTGGVVTTANTVGPSPSSFFDVLLRQPDGRLVAGGEFAPGASLQDIVLARYKPDGSLDRGFGHAGIVATILGGDLNVVNALVRQPDGKLVIAAGYGSNSGNEPSYSALVRFNPNGSPDQRFGRR